MDNEITDANDAIVDADIALLEQSIHYLDKVISSANSLATNAAWTAFGYFDAAQHEAIEHLFFRFLVSRRVLVSIALQENRSANHCEEDDDGDAGAKDDGDRFQRTLGRAERAFADEGLSESVRAIRTMTVLAAGLALYTFEGKWVQCFLNNKTAVAKLNEEFYRSDIPRGTFQKLWLECTDVTADGQIKSLGGAYRAYRDSRAPAATEGLTRAEELSQLIDSLVKSADSLTRDLVGRPNLMMAPSLKNKLQHGPLADDARRARSDAMGLLRKARACTFKGVSRLKSPAAHLITFSDQQKRDVLGIVRPGDVILTYTAGYMSDVFIPGAFKHGITYVGSPADREEAGLNADAVAKIAEDLPEGRATTLLDQFRTSAVPITNGRRGDAADADVIEAVAEGVIFNNLCHIMDTHINRLLILRPKITKEESADALMTVFRFLGDSYDFGFDFSDVSAVVCTEVIYHALNGKGRLAFELTRRAGHPTLSADDIVGYHLAHPDSFDFVLLALEDATSSCHEAKIHVGEDGRAVLAELMSAGEK